MSYKTKSAYRPRPDSTGVIPVAPGWREAVRNLRGDEGPSRVADMFARALTSGLDRNDADASAAAETVVLDLTRCGVRSALPHPDTAPPEIARTYFRAEPPAPTPDGALHGADALTTAAEVGLSAGPNPTASPG